MKQLYNIKMRASADGWHISGAENIVQAEFLAEQGTALLKRAMLHSKGQPDSIQIKAELLDTEKIQYVQALPVTVVQTGTASEGRQAVLDILARLGLTNAPQALDKLSDAYNLRGALLLDADTLEQLGDSGGVRATCMDGLSPAPRDRKNHFREAIVLATKVAHAPGIIAEICVSDDPDYVTGYVASLSLGYQRIMTLKNMGDNNGGRIFLYRGDREKVAECIDYLRNQPVIVNDLPEVLGRETVFSQKLADLRNAGLYRKIPKISSAPGPYMESGDRRLLLLSSNNYLDLANDIRIKKHATEMTERYGAGTGGARLTTGNTPLHDELESRLAEWKGTERALLFNTGYMANLGVLSVLNEHVIFSDEQNHASIIDGCRLSRARIIIYKHLDMDDLENKLRSCQGVPSAIVSDAVFSMSGEVADLPKLQALAEKYGAITILDEAHAIGVLGKTGGGLTEQTDIKPDIVVGTCSKALGSEGGFVCGSNVFIEYLLNQARSFIFSTALPSGSVAATLRALEILQTEPQRVLQLRENVKIFTQHLCKLGINVNSESAIIPIHIGDEGKAVRTAECLRESGFYISAIRYPTVPKGKAILRVSLMSAHTPEDLRAAAEAIAKAVK